QLAELRALYDNYFAGLERREPLRQREIFARALRDLQIEKRTTQISFRFSNLRARFATFEQHWNRIAKQIEEGTYKRDRQRAAKLPSAPAAAPAEIPAATPAAPAGGGQDLRRLYDNYAALRAKNQEAQVSYDAMVKSIQKQVPQIIERYKCKSVEFRVV